MIRSIFLVVSTVYHAIACYLEDRHSPPGQMIDIGSYRLHLYTIGKGNPTIILDHSLGGIEGYFLIQELSKLSRVCIYDRAGYGWSDPSPYPRNSQQIVQELDLLLTQAHIDPPYLLVGDSFGSYNVRLYAHLFPQKVVGIVLTDGLHETGMLKMDWSLKALKFFFISGFGMSVIGSSLGIIRVLGMLKIFERLKPELSRFSDDSLKWVKRSFYRPKHWITMSREMFNLNKSSSQVSMAQDFGYLPIISIKSSSFFKPSLFSVLIPLRQANQLREIMHQSLSQLSTDYQLIEANKSSHFVWIDQPEIMIEAVRILIHKINTHHSL